MQSVALRIIADREEEINAFIPEEYWSLDACLKVKGERKPLTAKFYGTADEKMTIHSEQEVNQILAELEHKIINVENVKKGERLKKAPVPFTTSTMQQEASNALNFATQKTMRIAQQLYEGITIKGSGTVGLITYLRTDLPVFQKRQMHLQSLILLRITEKNMLEAAAQQQKMIRRFRMRMRLSDQQILPEHLLW